MLPKLAKLQRAQVIITMERDDNVPVAMTSLSWRIAELPLLSFPQ
jgi:hypothetical protein